MRRFLIFFFLLGLASPVTASETVEGMKKDLEKFKQEMSLRLDKIGENLGELQKKAGRKGSIARDEAVENLSEAKERMTRELAQLREESGPRIERMKRNLAESIDDLNSRLQDFLKKEKEETGKKE